MTQHEQQNANRHEERTKHSMKNIIDGKAAAEKIRSDIKTQIESLCGEGRELARLPALVIIQVGENPASCTYVRNKLKAAEQVGINAGVYKLSESVSQATLNLAVKALSEDPLIDGVMVQLPLPEHLNPRQAMSHIPPDKDVDGLTIHSAGALMQKGGNTAFAPCTAEGIMRLLQMEGVGVAGKHAVVVGRSEIVGKPVAALLLEADATVTVCHSRTADLAKHTRDADILVVAAGKPGLITGNMVKPGAVVIDVGINRVDGKLVGDVDFESVREVADRVTPVPGGVGPMTVAVLMEHVVRAYKRTVRRMRKNHRTDPLQTSMFDA